MGLPVSIREVVEAMELPNTEWHSYLNADTGEIVTVTDEDQQLVEADEGPEELPEQQRVREALESDRFLELPGSFEIHEWSIMEAFGSSLEDERLHGEVLDALRGRGAFRMFRSTVRRLGIENDWYRYRESAFERIAREWLEANGVPYR